MAERARAAHAAWKKADEEAREAEQVLSAAWMKVMDGSGPPPPDELIQAVSRLRAVANEKLTLAMVALSGATSAPNPPPKR